MTDKAEQLLRKWWNAQVAWTRDDPNSAGPLTRVKAEVKDFLKEKDNEPVAWLYEHKTSGGNKHLYARRLEHHTDEFTETPLYRQPKE